MYVCMYAMRIGVSVLRIIAYISVNITIYIHIRLVRDV